MGGNGLSRPGGNLGCHVFFLHFALAGDLVPEGAPCILPVLSSLIVASRVQPFIAAEGNSCQLDYSISFVPASLCFTTTCKDRHWHCWSVSVVIVAINK